MVFSSMLTARVGSWSCSFTFSASLTNLYKHAQPSMHNFYIMLLYSSPFRPPFILVPHAYMHTPTRAYIFLWLHIAIFLPHVSLFEMSWSFLIASVLHLIHVLVIFSILRAGHTIMIVMVFFLPPHYTGVGAQVLQMP